MSKYANQLVLSATSFGVYSNSPQFISLYIKLLVKIACNKEESEMNKKATK